MKDRQNDLIDRFFTGDLTEEEDREFREKMTDKSFSKAVDLQVRLRRQLTERRNESDIGRLLREEAAKAGSSTGAVVSPLRRYRWALIASVLILLAGASLWWSGNQYGNEALIARFHEPVLDDTQAGVPQARDLLREAKRAYFREDFVRAENLSAAISPADSVFYAQAQALNGYALFRQKKYPAAIDQITRVLNTITLDLSFPAGGSDKLRWTRLLAYLGAGREDDPVFNEDLRFFLDGLNESYRLRARELQQRLNSGWRLFTY